jgi:DNA-3-methyladenine glycosylase I
MENLKKCEWMFNSPLLEEYHDNEWCSPIHDDEKLFEFLILEGAQAGLTWETVLKKREGYRNAFNNFNIKKVSQLTKKDEERLLQNPEIIRNRLKVASTVINAQLVLNIQKEFGSFDKYIWQFVGGKPIKNKFKSLKDIPAITKESDVMSKNLKKRGFKFVGSTICYAFMQAVGMVNDHEISCFRYNKV